MYLYFFLSRDTEESKDLTEVQKALAAHDVEKGEIEGRRPKLVMLTERALETNQSTEIDQNWNDAVFYRTDPLLYHKFGNMVIFRAGNLYSLYSPGNQDYTKITHF